MMENNNNNSNLNLNQNENNENTAVSLSDEQRVKVMSPSMLVFKRFIRNRLAVVGFIILAVMFLFSFVGPIFSPYGQAQTFTKTENVSKKYAEFGFSDWQFVTREDSGMSDLAVKTSMILLNSLSDGQEVTEENNSYKSGDETYTVDKLGDDAFIINGPVEIGLITVQGDSVSTEVTDVALNNTEFKNAAEAAMTAAREKREKTTSFTFGEGEEAVEYGIQVKSSSRGFEEWSITSIQPASIATKMVFHAASAESTDLFNDYDFAYNALNAFYGTTKTFSADGKSYTVTVKPPKNSGEFKLSEMDISVGGETVGRLTNYLINAKSGAFLDLEFKDALVNALINGDEKFTLVREVTAEDLQDESGEAATTEDPEVTQAPVADQEPQVSEIEYTIERQNKVWAVKADFPTLLFDTFAAPTSEHILGTDSYGMDVLTRLMHGGQVSLMVGFVVIFIEMLIGVILGGIAGYFSGWVDVLIMRLIELFNCIPFYPMLMIIGNLLSVAKATPLERIYVLMAVLGVLSWPGIARIVRGQILSLREQDFMVATEASGIPVTRRIFRHLLPNVIPLLIVQATMGLGSIIITEATLSFLGLGVQEPLASWGSIINQASNQFVMTNYWWIWIPAGTLILLTVLGFNFVGDGLRDAFDPKMKR